MGWRPQLNIVCGRCGKPRGLTHVCVSSSKRRATATPQVTFGKCPRCGKPLGGNPLGHVCRPKSDFRRRKAAAARRETAKARKKRQAGKHDYQACTDGECQRPLCVAFKTGHKPGYDRGWADGFPAGQAACPRPHQ